VTDVQIAPTKIIIFCNNNPNKQNYKLCSLQKLENDQKIKYNHYVTSHNYCTDVDDYSTVALDRFKCSLLVG